MLNTRNLGRSTPFIDELAEDRVKLGRTIGVGAQGEVRTGKLEFESKSPLYFALKGRSERGAFTSNTPQNERHLHKVAHDRNPVNHEDRGILPYCGTFNQKSASGVTKTYHAMPLCEAILGDSIPAIIDLSHRDPTTFNHFLYS